MAAKNKQDAPLPPPPPPLPAVQPQQLPSAPEAVPQAAVRSAGVTLEQLQNAQANFEAGERVNPNVPITLQPVTPEEFAGLAKEAGIPTEVTALTLEQARRDFMEKYGVDPIDVEARPAALTAPYVMAVYSGTYFKPHGAGAEKAPFTIEVKIPAKWLGRDDYSPVGLFQKYLAAKVMPRDFPGYSGIATCSLVGCSDLPSGLPEVQFLNWTADFDGLAEHIRRRRLPVRPELYGTVDDLRHAIKRAIAEPEAFAKEQQMREKGPDMKHMQAEQDLRALGYE